jgi:hypothetical protein
VIQSTKDKVYNNIIINNNKYIKQTLSCCEAEPRRLRGTETLIDATVMTMFGFSKQTVAVPSSITIAAASAVVDGSAASFNLDSIVLFLLVEGGF